MLMNNMPLVTVVIPCYNHEQFIKHSIQSLIDQTYENIELIIIDDGSSDNSVFKIEEMAKLCEIRFNGFKFINRQNEGLSKTLNEALLLAQGQYFTICSSDDFYHKNKIKRQIEFFSKNRNYKFCITGAYVVNDQDLEIKHETILYNNNLNDHIKFDDIFLFRTHLPVTGMYETDFLKSDLGGYDSSLSAEDYDINLRIVTFTKIGYIAEKLYFYRSASADGGKRKRMPMRIDVSESHLQSINKYSEHPKYYEALNEWNYRRFIFFSGYLHTKKYALMGMLSSLNKWRELTFYKSLVKLLIIWKT